MKSTGDSPVTLLDANTLVDMQLYILKDECSRVIIWPQIVSPKGHTPHSAE